MKALRGVIVLVLALVLPAPVLAAGLEAGVEAYDRGDYATALKEWRPLAEQGNAAAQVGLGAMYRQGKGVPQNHVEAESWFRKAIENGYEPAKGFLRDMRWDWKKDANGDGKITISDLGGWVTWVLFWPGDWIIDLVIENAPQWAEFFELKDDPFEGVLSGILSGVIWCTGLVIWGAISARFE